MQCYFFAFGHIVLQNKADFGLLPTNSQLEII